MTEKVLTFLKELFPLVLCQKVWLVGGSVRDLLLGKDIKDLDLVTLLAESELENLGFRLVKGVTTAPIWFMNSKAFGNIEVTAVGCQDGLLADLKRRDFRLDAILMTLDGEILDPLGGLTDLENRRLEPCSAQILSEDPLRIFRAFRLEAEGFSASDTVIDLIKKTAWNDILDEIPVERFSREMLKALEGATPGRFFQRMVDLRVGNHYLPELFRMSSIPAGPIQYHPEGDLLTHSMQVLERVCAVTDSALARFCAFFHDLGKLSTESIYFPKHHGHDESGYKNAPGFCRRLALPGDYGSALAWVSRLHSNANRFGELRPSTRLRVVEQSMRAGIIDILPLVCSADKPGGSVSKEWNDAVSVAGLCLKELGISQDAIESMKPSLRGEFILQKRVELLKNL